MRVDPGRKALAVALALDGWRHVMRQEPPGCRLEDVDVHQLGPVELEVLGWLTMGPDGGVWLLPWLASSQGFPGLVGLPMTIAQVARLIRDLSRPGTPYGSVRRAVRTLERRGLLRRASRARTCFILPAWSKIPAPGSLVMGRKSGSSRRSYWWKAYADRKGRDRRGRFVAG